MAAMPPPTTWLVQVNMGSQSDILRDLAAIRATGQDAREFVLRPMSDDLPDAEPGGPVVCYGSTTYVTVAARAGLWSPGVWFDEEAFTYEAWARNYGDLLLNDPAECLRTTIAGVAALDRPADEMVFLRPERDLKEFSGEVRGFGEAREWCRDVCAGGYPLIGPDTPVVLGPPHGIAAEWRLFMVDGRVAAATLYRERGRLRSVEGAPPDVVAFGEAAAARWSPAPVFVLDVCRSGPGLYVVEAQCFNSAGFYGADLEALFGAVGAYAAEAHVPGAAR